MTAISVRNIRKAFGATVALDDVSFAVAEGAVHALLGENGAGKSTIVKMLSGLLRPDAGELAILDRPARFGAPRAAPRAGVQTAFQELTQVAELTVAENMLMPYAPVNLLGQVRRRRAEAAVVAHLERLGLGEVHPREEVRRLDLSIRQKIEIARAIFRQPRILLLDEPTSSLSGRDIDWLGGLIAEQKAAGTTILFISHRMPEVRRFCDTLTVLRNGKDVGTAPVGELDDDAVIRMIIGRSLAATFPERRRAVRPDLPPALSARGLATMGKLRDASFDLQVGEVLGVAALQGMGQQDLFLSCFGMAEATAGSIAVNGKEVAITTPVDAVRASIGISLVPEERKTEALLLELDGRVNVSLPVVDRFTRFGIVQRGREAAAVNEMLDLVQVHRRALYTPLAAFSGGNQQKVAIAKWLLARSATLMMFDPTRGVDIGTKHELYVLIRAFAEAGGAVLFHSTEIAELVNLCDRVLVMYRGRMVAELAGEAITEEAIMRAALGGTAPSEAAA
ncbi:MAG: sugar ABC transporter ATP-binding protein [Alphaproteobacteria bacterium]